MACEQRKPCIHTYTVSASLLPVWPLRCGGFGLGVLFRNKKAILHLCFNQMLHFIIISKRCQSFGFCAATLAVLPQASEFPLPCFSFSWGSFRKGHLDSSTRLLIAISSLHVFKSQAIYRRNKSRIHHNIMCRPVASLKIFFLEKLICYCQENTV